jgi:hypothetical protein
VKPLRVRLADKRPNCVKFTKTYPLSVSHANQNIAAINVNKLSLTKAKSSLSISFALEMTIEQRKTTKTPDEIINPSKYSGEKKIPPFKCPETRTPSRREKETNRMMTTRIVSLSLVVVFMRISYTIR